MKLPFVKRKKYKELQEAFAHENMNNRILATKLKRVQNLCDDHTNKKMGNLRFVTIVKEVMEKA